MITLQLIAIILEAIIVVFCVFASVQKRRFSAYGFALTFIVYFFYDSVVYFGLSVERSMFYILFFLATLSAFLGAVLLYLEETPKIIKARKK